MKVRYEASFEKDLKRVTDKKILVQVKQIIDELKQAINLDTLNNVRKLKGHDTFYRIRLGDYRMGLEVLVDEVILVRLLHRKDIYKYFP